MGKSLRAGRAVERPALRLLSEDLNMNCKKCGKPFSWADEMANDALRKGNMTEGLCRECRAVFTKEYEKKRERYKKKFEN